jgi:hypothetical protein
MEYQQHPEFIQFLREELLISESELSLALRSGESDPCLLSVTLWRYGFVTLAKLEQIFDWLAIA